MKVKGTQPHFKAFDTRWFVIGVEIAIVVGMGVAWYRDYRLSITTGEVASSTPAAPIASSTVATTSVAARDGKGGDVTATTTRINVWHGTSTATGSLPYIEVVDGCGPHYGGVCLNARSGPGTSYPVMSQLRNGTVLPVARRVERNGEVWYQVDFARYTHVLYPERITNDWYVNDRYVRLLYEPGEQVLKPKEKATTTKRIVVDRATQSLTAYNGTTSVFTMPVSTGLDLTPTPLGTFRVFMKTPSSYMQGPSKSLPLKQYYDLPGVPWDLFFTKEGAVIHGAYWHNAFGQQYSHGCVNLSPSDSYKLYEWTPLGTPVQVIN